MQKRVVAIVHGIHESREVADAWMRPLGDRIVKACPDVAAVELYEYGWVAAAAIRLPLVGGAFRATAVVRFQEWAFSLLEKYGRDLVLDVVAHSFGTYLVGHAMTDDGARRLFARDVVLMGSILSSRDDWSARAGHFSNVLNLWSSGDRVVEASTFGQSGFKGFVQAPPEVQNIDESPAAHGDYTRPGRPWDDLVGWLAMPSA